MEEVADSRIVAVAVDDFALEVVSVMLQLFLDDRKLGVELVLLRISRFSQSLILCFCGHWRYGHLYFGSTL